MISILHFTIIPISTLILMELLLVRYSNPCLRLFIVILQDLHCLHRFYHNVDHWGIELYYHKKFHI